MCFLLDNHFRTHVNRYIMKKQLVTIFVLFLGILSFAQETKETPKDAVHIYNGNQELIATQFPEAEAEYRKAISINPANATSKFNLGNAYYKNKKTKEALARFNQAQKVAKTKSEKHKAFHNMGNSYMQQKDFKNAIEMYKNALRNIPTDEETRYNLALAKKEKENKDKQDKEKNKDKNDKDKEKNKDKKDQDKDGDKKDDKSEKNKDKGDDKNKDKDSDPKDEGKEDKEKDKQNKDPKEDKKEKDKQDQKAKPKPGQLSPQQVQQLLKAMDNEEKKLQQKMNTKKGVPVQNDKDW